MTNRDCEERRDRTTYLTVGQPVWKNLEMKNFWKKAYDENNFKIENLILKSSNPFMG